MTYEFDPQAYAGGQPFPVIPDLSVAGPALLQLVSAFAGMFQSEADKATQQLVELREQANGLRRNPDVTNAERRLDNLHGRTTYAADNLRSLRRLQVGSLDQLGRTLPETVEAVVRLLYAEQSIRATEAIIAEKEARRAHFKAEGLYPAVAKFAAEAHKRYGVTHHHWACASAEAMALICHILQGRVDVAALVERHAELAKLFADRKALDQ